MSNFSKLKEIQNSQGYKKFLLSSALKPGIFSIVVLGLVLSIIIRVSGNFGSIGVAVTLGVPLAMGFYIGMFHQIHFHGEDKPRLINWWKVTKVFIWLTIALSLGYGAFFAFDAVRLNYNSPITRAANGFFCGAMFGLVFILPTIFGLSLSYFLGRLYRFKLLEQYFGKNGLTAIALLICLSLPSGLEVVEDRLGWRDNLSEERVLTNREIRASVVQVWNGLQFYEDTGSEASLLFTLNFPRPLYTEGKAQKVGDITKCVYDRGYLVKRTTKVQLSENQAFLSFDVIEQVNIENRAMALKDGSFTLIKSENGVKIKLMTHYTPFMTPRWIWRPVEAIVARSLHNHVLDKIEADISYPALILAKDELKNNLDIL